MQSAADLNWPNNTAAVAIDDALLDPTIAAVVSAVGVARITITVTISIVVVGDFWRLLLVKIAWVELSDPYQRLPVLDVQFPSAK